MFVGKKYQWREIFIILLIILGAAFFRIKAYQDALSIGNSDTISYIQSGNLPLCSIEFFTAQRPFPISLVYKVLQPSTGYELTLINKAWVGTAQNRVMQPGLDRITITQSLFSIFAWSLLAFITSLFIRNIFLKIISVLLILTFAYSPQLADWDGVLMSESFSFSYFALFLSLSILIVHWVWSRPKEKKTLLIIWVLWVIILFVWVFIRDSNAYVILVSILMMLLLLFIPSTREKINIHSILVMISILAAIFFVHTISLRASERWINPLFNNLLKNVLPYPEHVEFMVEKGMPVNDQMYALLDSPGNELGFFEINELVNWVETKGYSAYSQFLISHPLWTAERLFDNLPLFFTSNRQPYFRGTPESTPLWLLPVGDKLHVRSPWVIAYNFILTVAITIVARSKKIEGGIAWAAIFIWLLASEMALLFVSFHGDALGVERHTLAAVMPLRLSVWMLTVVFCDLLMAKGSKEDVGQ